MFKFLKDRLKGAIKKFSKDVETKADVDKEEIPEAPKKTAPIKRKAPAKKEAAIEEQPEEPRKKEGFLKKITKVTLSEKKFDDIFWELEVTLMESNVAVEVIEKIKEDLKRALTGEKMGRRGIEEKIIGTLKQSIKDILSIPPIGLLKKAKEKQPLIIAVVGVNGSGKTTTLAKLVQYFQQHGKSVVVAAADTFRAAAIQQLEEHTNKLDVKLIKHDYGSDPAAVAYDAIKHAAAKRIDVVLIDSAGRLHSDDNLMNELKKLVRINKPDLNVFVGEAVTGNDCVEQARLFDQAVGIDAIILAKADVDEKGGAAISASYVTKKPVIFLGTGQSYDDLTAFKPDVVLENLGL
ncbi:signal recognition particle-docking protein FtsY [Candidatus Woesearchaeota archaeon]|nr:signal recognition particle-docking protein FtsY [Candidatus Woesearchaeota archaeon]